MAEMQQWCYPANNDAFSTIIKHSRQCWKQRMSVKKEKSCAKEEPDRKIEQYVSANKTPNNHNHKQHEQQQNQLVQHSFQQFAWIFPKNIQFSGITVGKRSAIWSAIGWAAIRSRCIRLDRIWSCLYTQQQLFSKI